LSQRVRFLVPLLAVLCASATALERDVRNGVEYVAGVYGSILVHEVGHALSAKAFGATDVTIKIPNDTLLSGLTTVTHGKGGFSRGQSQAFAASGLVSANLIGELVIQRQGLHGSPFSQSLLGATLASNVMHVYAYYTKVRGRDGYRGNDIDAFELSGGNPHLLSAGLLAYTAWSLQRVSKKRIPLFGVQIRF
jgi:hypothetical protein